MPFDTTPTGRNGNFLTAAKILIIEDEKDVFNLLDYHFKACGFETFWADNGVDGIACIHERRPDAILLDVMLPRISGYEVCRTIKSEPGFSKIPIVMITARVESGEKLRGFECGADDYLTKPFHPRKVVERVRELLIRRSLPLSPENPTSLTP